MSYKVTERRDATAQIFWCEPLKSVSSPFSSIIAIFNRANKIWVETLLLSGKVRIIFWVFSQSQLYLEFLLPDTWWKSFLNNAVQYDCPESPSESIDLWKQNCCCNKYHDSPVLSVLQRKTWYMFSVSATFDAAAPWWDQSLAFHTCRRSLCWLAAGSSDVCFTGFSAGCSLMSLTGILLFYDLFYLFIISLVEWNTLKGIKD